MKQIRDCDLPGIGHKYVIETRSEDKLVIIVHDDGRREMYHFDHEDPDESISMITLDDDEARQIAGIVGGMAYKPKALESIEVALDELIIEWYKIEPHAVCVGKTIGEINVRHQSGATIIAMLGKENERVINPGPDSVLKAHATLVVAGERQQIMKLKQILMNGE
ncbi:MULTISPECIES: cation:proton antiporter regulatory subunit [Paenibacillus]|uniref:cation:proton antiporter regulatory subunit n=1 Tax=Paenibacillus TaxID=44249 RepID=UPI00036C6214|nr:cation:proton antiporter regulatory subunit [Paenibacillus terrigena]